MNEEEAFLFWDDFSKYSLTFGDSMVHSTKLTTFPANEVVWIQNLFPIFSLALPFIDYYPTTFLVINFLLLFQPFCSCIWIESLFPCHSVSLTPEGVLDKVQFIQSEKKIFVIASKVNNHIWCGNRWVDSLFETSSQGPPQPVFVQLDCAHSSLGKRCLVTFESSESKLLKCYHLHR